MCSYYGWNTGSEAQFLGPEKDATFANSNYEGLAPYDQRFYKDGDTLSDGTTLEIDENFKYFFEDDKSVTPNMLSFTQIIAADMFRYCSTKAKFSDFSNSIEPESDLNYFALQESFELKFSRPNF